MKKTFLLFLFSMILLLSVFLIIEYRNSTEKIIAEPSTHSEDLLVYRNSELISESDDWRVPNWYVTTDPIEAVIDYYLSELGSVSYEVEDLHEGTNGRFRLQHNNYDNASFQEGIWIYQVDITAFSNINEGHQKTYFNDIVVDPDQITVAVFYHR